MDLDNIKVKAVEFVDDNKSKQEIESELLKKHEQELQSEESEVKDKNEETTESVVVSKEEKTEEVVEPEKTPSSELSDEDVLSYIKNRYNKDISSVDDLFTQKKDNDELPEEVSAYLKYKKETGRGIEDFYKLQKDFDVMEDDQLLATYYEDIEDGLDALDIQDLIEEKFSFDEELDEVRDIKKRKLAKKRELAKAKNYFNDQKDKYKVPLESRGNGLSDKDKETITAYKSYIDESNTVQEVQKKKYDWFLKKTDEVFNNEFKGFEFNVGDDTITFSPNTLEELKKSALDPGSWATKYLDDSGLIKDSVGFHRSVAVAQNPEKFAKFFYEQGKSNATEDVMRKTKNINMSERRTPEVTSKGGTQFKSLSNESGKGLKIRSAKRK